jgi:hypothetical protein
LGAIGIASATAMKRTPTAPTAAAATAFFARPMKARRVGPFIVMLLFLSRRFPHEQDCAEQPGHDFCSGSTSFGTRAMVAANPQCRHPTKP